MIPEVLDPLNEYINVFQPRFKEVADQTFTQFANEAQVDSESNRLTCNKLYERQKDADSVKKKLGARRFWRGFFIVVAITIVVCVIAAQVEFESQLFLLSLLSFCVFISLAIMMGPKIKALKTQEEELRKIIKQLKDEAWAQMKPLNRLYDWDIFSRMITKTVPKLEFDPYFTTQRLADLQEVYNWDGSFNTNRSVIYSHSGLIRGNPFIICRTRKMKMGKKTYYGSKTIHWVAQERDSNGQWHSVHRSQTLTASVTAPFPEYFEKTRVIYGNTAAPDLTFHRRQSGLAGREGSLSYKSKKRALQRKARNLKNADYAMMTNEDFEVAFNTSNRNDNQQFALLFSPLAQENILKILKDRQAGYGDDFDFIKEKKINTIVPIHMQELSFDMNPSQFEDFDYEKAKEKFYTLNSSYFRAFYFSLAPLLCVPMYQQIRPQHDIYGHDMQRRSAFWEHESLANFWGQRHFKHPSCVTDCILKTEQSTPIDGKSTITVYAYGYRTVRRLHYEIVWGGDGNLHQVPVYWDEYIPVVGSGTINMSEDNECKDNYETQTQRISHINEVLSKTDSKLYRRHIASTI